MVRTPSCFQNGFGYRSDSYKDTLHKLSVTIKGVKDREVVGFGIIRLYKISLGGSAAYINIDEKWVHETTFFRNKFWSIGLVIPIIMEYQ